MVKQCVLCWTNEYSSALYILFPIHLILYLSTPSPQARFLFFISIHLTVCPRSLPSLPPSRSPVLSSAPPLPRPTSISKAYFLPQCVKYSTFSIFSFRINFSHCYCTFLSGNLVQIFKNKEFFVESLNICFLCKTLNASFSPKNFCSIFSRLHVFSSIQENHPKV